MNNKEKDTRDQITMFVLAWVPDFAIAYAAMKLTDNEASTFWWTWIAIQIIALLYYIKARLWSSILWRVWLRRRTTAEAENILRACKFPEPSPWDHDIETYFTRLAEDEKEALPIRLRAAEWRTALSCWKSASIQRAMQIGEAWDEGMHRYRLSFLARRGPGT